MLHKELHSKKAGHTAGHCKLLLCWAIGRLSELKRLLNSRVTSSKLRHPKLQAVQA
jgi:hypothetical protein